MAKKGFSDEEQRVLDFWFSKKSLSEGTRGNYINVIKQYRNLIDKPLNVLIDEAKEDKDLAEDEQRTTYYYLKFKQYRTDKGICNRTVNQNLNVLNSLYGSYKLPLPEIEFPRYPIRLPKNEGKIMSNEEIQSLIGVAGTRDRAIIYLLALTGMRQKEVRNLKVKDILKSVQNKFKHVTTLEDLFKFEDEYEETVFKLDIYSSKNFYTYPCFITYEALRYILLYLKERLSGSNPNIILENVDDWLFVNKFGDKIADDNLTTNFRDLGYKAGFSKEKGAYSWWRTHSFRHRYISMGINKLRLKDFVLDTTGHRTADVSENYLHRDMDDYESMYLELYPFISIDGGKSITVTDKKIKELEEELSEVRGVVDKIHDAAKSSGLDEVLKREGNIFDAWKTFKKNEGDQEK